MPHFTLCLVNCSSKIGFHWEGGHFSVATQLGAQTKTNAQFLATRIDCTLLAYQIILRTLLFLNLAAINLEVGMLQTLQYSQIDDPNSDPWLPSDIYPIFRILPRLWSPDDDLQAFPRRRRRCELRLLVLLDGGVPLGAHPLRLRRRARDGALLRAQSNHHQR